MSLDCRIAGLLAFYESRNCDDADKGPGGQFTEGNDCGGGGGSGGAAKAEDTNTLRVVPLPSSGSVRLGAAKIKRAPPFRGAEKLASLSVDEAANVRSAQKQLDNSTFGELAKILVADVENANVKLTTDSQTIVSQSEILVDTKDATKGKISIVTSLNYGRPPYLTYETFSLNEKAKKSASSVSFANDIMDLMLDSLEQAEKSGVAYVETHAAGDAGDKTWQGYRLWGKFGFDAELLPRWRYDDIPDDVLGKEAMLSRKAGDPITLQQLLATPQGTKWWQKNGSTIRIGIDFTDKESLGYKRFKKLLEVRKRHRERGGEKRSFMQWLYETDDVSEQSLIEYRNCGTGAGGFQKGNECSGSEGKPPVESPKNVRRKGDQTGVARKLYSIGTTERKVSELIGELGGSPKSSTVDINGNRVNVHVRDKSGKNLYFMEIRYSGARLYPLEAKGKLSQGEAKKFAESVRKAMPAKYGKKTDQDFKVSVMKDPEDFKQWQREDDERIKSVEDKYRFSLELPPHQRPKKSKRSLEITYASLLAFADARNCGTGAGGFQKGNSCGGGGSLKTQEGSATSAAKGAVSGAVKGAATGFAVGGVAGLAPGAAAGAVIGAVRGIYDDKMRPTRVSKRLESYGVTEPKISSLVKKLGGSSESSAKLARQSVVVDVKDDSGKKLFKVEIENSEVTIYPSSKTGKLSDGELKKVKELAREFVPQQVNVVVKPSNTAYTKKLIGKGMKIAAKAAGLYIAHWTVPAVLGEVEGSLGKYRKEDMGRKPRKDW